MKEKLQLGINNVLGYVVLILVSMITYNFIPVGAIVGTVAFFAMSLPIIFAVIISLISLIIVSPVSISVYVIFLLLFVMETLLFKPLVSFEKRNEQKKVGTYLVITMFILQLINLGVIRSLTFSLLMFVMYKTIINGLAVIFNEDNKFIFSDEEWLAVSLTLMIAITFNYNIVKNINILGLNIQNIYILALGIFAGICVIKRGIILGMLNLGMGYILIKNIAGANILADISLNMLYIAIFTMFVAIIRQFNKKYMLLSLWTLNLIMFLIMYNQLHIYIHILIISIIVSVIELKEGEFDFSKVIKTEFILGDGRERRLKASPENEGKKEKKRSEKEEYIFNKMQLEENLREFEEKIILDKKIKKLKIYNQIVYFDKIIKNIYLECIKNDKNLNIYEICDILNINNLIIDIEDANSKKELNIIKDVSLKIISELYKNASEKYERDIQQENTDNTSVSEDIKEQNEEKDTVMKKIVEINKKTIKSLKSKLLKE